MIIKYWPRDIGLWVQVNRQRGMPTQGVGRIESIDNVSDEQQRVTIRYVRGASNYPQRWQGPSEDVRPARRCPWSCALCNGTGVYVMLTHPEPCDKCELPE
jgi:hypothetical protein